jgi:hypothetical protein
MDNEYSPGVSILSNALMALVMEQGIARANEILATAEAKGAPGRASAASARGARIRPAAPAAAMPPKKPRRVWINAIASLPARLGLQLAF